MLKRHLFSLVLASSLLGGAVMAAEAPANPEQQTSWGLYLDAREAWDMKQKQGNKMLFVDVRDPIEIMFVGFTDAVDVNIPFKLSDPTAWNGKKSVYQMRENPDFEKQLAAALEKHGLTKDDPIVLMCRSGGTRGAPATKPLEDKGYKQVYVVTDGFEGGKAKDGEKKGWRVVNGWKNAGLPWSYKLNKDKMFMPASENVGSK